MSYALHHLSKVLLVPHLQTIVHPDIPGENQIIGHPCDFYAHLSNGGTAIISVQYDSIIMHVLVHAWHPAVLYNYHRMMYITYFIV